MRLLVSLLTASALVSSVLACAPTKPAASTTSTTSAEYAGTGGENAAAREEAAAADGSVGQLVCQTSSKTDGTLELRLDWKGTTAAGTLRRVAPSGAVTEQRVTAEQFEGKIVADDIWSKDVAVHAAVVRQLNGKKQITVGDAAQGWKTCD